MPRRRPSAGELGRVFDGAARPVYVIDAAGRIAYLNPACVEWLGEGADELVGVACRYGVAAEATGATALAAGLCPPPEVFLGERTRAPVVVGPEDAVCVAEFIPFVTVDGTDDEQAVLAIVHEAGQSISEIEPALSDDSRALHAALLIARRALPGRYRPESLIGRSPAIRRVRRQVQVAAAERATVAIHGLPGSGRQHVARAIHYAQAPPVGVFVPIACVTLTPEMIFSYLAGLANNAQREPGTATVFLQDVDSLPPEVQEKLLARVQTIRVPMRWMISSAAPLDELASAGKFLSELAQLLSTIVIRVPSLSERLDDLPLVAQAFLEERNGHGGRQLSGFTPEALDVLAAHPPQGGWDELAEWVREAHGRATGQFIDRAALPDRVRYIADAGVYRRPAEETIDLEKFLAEIELELIQRALAQAKGNKTKAAELLGMNRPKFYRRLEQLGLVESDE